ncbi:SusC/RagA family TonB-linked outer membrane protein [Ekhidna sp.]|uniref:SusC/RagA family TonB-linked outer membrane protein n=1 Tax=Ekhidna sp. TaxID=2608089 RepID=UPI003511F25D
MERFLRGVFTLVLLASICPQLIAQNQTISGKVVDATDGTSLIGVTIMVKGSGQGASTDIDGNYRINASNTDVLVFSYIGYKTVEIPVGGQSTIDLKMESEVSELEEVMVVGYGTLRKREITGSITKIGGDELQNVQAPSFEAALQGKAAGVQVIQGSGLAGSGSVIRIRGIGSISAGGDPLYVVDGIPITQSQFTNVSRNGGAMNTNPLATLNPNDIASIEILKDAAAAGIYGSRGSNGVILITTKRASSKGNSFNFSSKAGISEPVAKAKMLNSEQYLQLYQEAWENDGNVGRATLPGGMTWEEIERRNIDTDWWDQNVQTGFKQEYNFSWTRGGEKLKTYFGISYSDNESYLVGNSYDRASARLNADYILSTQTKLSSSLSYSRGNNERVNAAWSGGLGDAMSTALPIYPIYNDDGTFWVQSGVPNSVRQRALTDWNTVDTRIIGNLNISHSLPNGINLRGGGSYDYFKSNDDKWEAGELVGRNDIIGQAYANITEVDNYNANLTADYTFKAGAGNLKVLVGSEYQQSVRSAVTGKGVTDVSEQLRFDPIVGENGETFGGTPLQDEVTKFISFFSRFNYNVRNKYFFQATLRTDGSSKFGPDNRFGFFPTVGFSWFASEEDFLQSVDAISLLKFKINYGITGNSDFGANEFIGTYQRQGPPDQNGYGFNPILYPTKLPNPDLKWETTSNFDIGFEAGFFNDRIIVEFDYFRKLTSDVLAQIALPPQNGIDNSVFENVGEISNNGFEVSVSTVNISNGDFEWATNFNISQYKNKIESIGNFSEEAVSGGTNDTRVIVGQPVGTNFLVRFSHVDPQSGRPVYLDIDGNETFDWDPKDRVAVGNVLPDFTGGITNTFTYKSWNFSFLFVFTKGGDIYDSSSKRQLGVVTTWNMREDIFDRWRQPGDIATYPRLTLDTETYGSGTPWINTDLWLHDGSYIRLRNVSLTYNLPQVIDLVKSASVTFSATNLLTFTNFIGLDPEIARDFEDPTDRNMSSNITFLTPPQERTFNLGININF